LRRAVVRHRREDHLPDPGFARLRRAGRLFRLRLGRVVPGRGGSQGSARRGHPLGLAAGLIPAVELGAQLVEEPRAVVTELVRDELARWRRFVVRR
jgi:hypothetical protein